MMGYFYIILSDVIIILIDIYLLIIFHSLSSLSVQLPFNLSFIILSLSLLFGFSRSFIFSFSYSIQYISFLFLCFSSPHTLHCSLITLSLFSLQRYTLFIYLSFHVPQGRNDTFSIYFIWLYLLFIFISMRSIYFPLDMFYCFVFKFINYFYSFNLLITFCRLIFLYCLKVLF